MLILGIDPGTATTGYGFIEFKGNSYKAMSWGLIETDKESIPGKRLVKIYEEMSAILKESKPDVIAIEKLFFATNAKTAMRVGQAQGVMFYCAARANIDVFEYAPGTIKKMIAGNGRADKKEMQQSLRKIFGNKVRSKAKQRTHFDNAADALAVALCHIYKISDINMKKDTSKGVNMK
ncbi:crossover junction endodeoxyribonuclease RuvC [Candidatus Woesebacteria bacterium RBG_16_36_11]|uniref:Crossover junction endodeoxyribonuclease RuvC n=2 Tax=Candidatus Woeseibacteriota TaxID=1752722 RepID=A0A1F7XAX8_9BACT|nr:MAG: crossover junction endodeoxyribonuclease RuvC [Candidatus Woesebacteria bacterium RBG_16_36_11]OGM16508.1 MAG: crossover junction endodeoxyribonuclease RuvC [Candidatus Woesebacteria bacterium RBG_19FT_COMBO_37_29]